MKKKVPPVIAVDNLLPDGVFPAAGSSPAMLNTFTLDTSDRLSPLVT